MAGGEKEGFKPSPFCPCLLSSPSFFFPGSEIKYSSMQQGMLGGRGEVGCYMLWQEGKREVLTRIYAVFPGRKVCPNPKTLKREK